MHPIAGGALVDEITLRDGDLLVMGGSMQQTHKHSVPKPRRTEHAANRINWTVRAFQRS